MTIRPDNILYALKKPRFPIGRILLAVFAITAIFWLIALGTVSYLPKTAFDNYNYNNYDPFKIKNILEQIVSIIFFTVFFYGVLNIYYYADVLKKKAKSYIFYSLFFVVFFIVYTYIGNVLFPENIDKTKKVLGQHGILFFYIVGIFTWAVIVLLIITYVLSSAKARDEKNRNRELLERNSQLEIEKLRAEYNFLKAQINPHFIHNSLNFLYAKSLPYSPELSDGILTISEIMRYALMNEANSDGLVLLSKEIDHIRNIIKMNQLRFDNKLNIAFSVADNIAGIRIIPLVLITIIENAFKHGDIRHNDYPLVIEVRLDENYIYFSCSNKKKNGQKELSFGIGLNNTRSRLQMIYGENARIIINDSKEQYEVKLKIPYTR